MKTGSTSSDSGAPCCANGSGSTQVVHMYSKCRVYTVKVLQVVQWQCGLTCALSMNQADP